MKRFICCLSLLVSIFFSSCFLQKNTYAVDLSQTVDFVGSGDSGVSYTTSNCRIVGTRVYNQNSDHSDCSISDINLYFNGTYEEGDILVFDFWANELANSSSLHDTVRKAVLSNTTYSSYIDFMGVDIQQFSSNSSKLSFIFYVNHHYYADSTYLKLQNNGQAVFIIASNSGNSWFDIDKMYHFRVRQNADNVSIGEIRSALSDQTHDLVYEMLQIEDQLDFIGETVFYSKTNLDDINNHTSDINEKLYITNDKLDSLSSNGVQTNNKLDSLNEKQQQANDDANSRYEDEKNSTESNAQSGASLWNYEQFQFSFSNPFDGLLGMFTNEQCADITVLASLLHSPTTTYCSWWSTNLRNITTPIFNIFGTSFIVGIIINWLKKEGI